MRVLAGALAVLFLARAPSPIKSKARKETSSHTLDHRPPSGDDCPPSTGYCPVTITCGGATANPPDYDVQTGTISDTDPSSCNTGTRCWYEVGDGFYGGDCYGTAAGSTTSVDACCG